MDHLNNLEPTAELAKKRTRVFAALVDYIIFFGIFFFIAVTYGEKEYNPNGYSYVIKDDLPKLSIFVIWILLFPVLEGLTGQTIGKKIFKTKVVTFDYIKASLGASIIRHFFDFIDGFMFGLVGMLVASNNKLKQRIGDLVAKTIVIDIPRSNT